MLVLLISCATKKQPEFDAEEDPAEKVDVPTPYYLWAFKPQVNLRADNKSSAPMLTQLADGDSVIILNSTDGWYQVKTTADTIGWVRTDLLGAKNLSAFSRAVSLDSFS